MSYRLGIDVGGTFTDLLLFNEATGAMSLEKTPSTPADQSIGILNGINKIVESGGLSPDDVKLILHGTTVATNAVLEGKGALVGLITTKGFEQILHVARSQTPGPLAGWIIMQKPDPLAPLYLTRGASCRMTAKGAEASPVDEAEIRLFVNRGFDRCSNKFICGRRARACDPRYCTRNVSRSSGDDLDRDIARVSRIRTMPDNGYEFLCSAKNGELS
jgi:N-methylhydantoinase A/oxoprolinase/acetone carboxylase beta subunit